MEDLSVRFSAFNETPSSQYFLTIEQSIRSEIESKSRQYILSVDEGSFISGLVEKYKIATLRLGLEPSEQSVIPAGVKSFSESGSTKYSEAYEIKIKYDFSGEWTLFKVRPMQAISNLQQPESRDIFVKARDKQVCYTVETFHTDIDKAKKELLFQYKIAFQNLDILNKEVELWNSGLREKIYGWFVTHKQKMTQEDAFISALSIRVDPATKEIFDVAPVSIAIVPQPVVEPDQHETAFRLTHEIYKDVIKVLNTVGQAMEKRPSLHIDKGEDAIRDILLLFLETRYIGTTATAETFNRKGDADIVLKHADSAANLFVAECKIWHGEAKLLEAISQLFDRYLTTRDAKVAVLVFVREKSFTEISKKAQEAVTRHDYFVATNGTHGSTSFSYIFRLPHDPNKQVFMELILFDLHIS
jgi:hypothetical protein